jgi:hypothetical protein
LKDVDLDNMTFVTFPSVPYTADVNKVMPSEALSEELLTRLQNDEPIRLDENALRDGSIVNADGSTTAPTPTDTATTPVQGDPSVEPTTDPSTDVVAGLQGQSAAQQTCTAGRG